MHVEPYTLVDLLYGGLETRMILRNCSLSSFFAFGELLLKCLYPVDSNRDDLESDVFEQVAYLVLEEFGNWFIRAHQTLV